MKKQGRRDFFLVGCSLLLAMAAGGALAADMGWANTATDYNAAGSWTNGVAPGPNDNAWFTTDPVTQPDLSVFLTNNALRFAPDLTTNAATSAGSGYTLTGSGGASLTLKAAGTYEAAYTLIQKATGTNTIAANLVLNAQTAERRFDIRAGTLVLAGTLASLDDEIVVYSSVSGTVFRLSGSNTFSGSLQHTGMGALQIAHPHALSTASLLLGNHGGNNGNFAVLDNVTGAPLTLPGNNPVRLNGGTGVRFVGTHSLNCGTGAVTMVDSVGRDCPLNLSGARLTFGGPLGEGTNAVHNLRKLGPGTLELRAASTYSGYTEVSGGSLLLNHPGALAASNLRLRGSGGNKGVLGLGTGDFTRPLGTGAGQVQWLGGGGYTSDGGFAAYNADRVVNLGGASASSPGAPAISSRMSWRSGRLTRMPRLISRTPSRSAAVPVPCR